MMAKTRVAAVRRVLQPAGLSNVKAKQLRGAIARIVRDFGRCDLREIRNWPESDIENYLVGLPRRVRESRKMRDDVHPRMLRPAGRYARPPYRVPPRMDEEATCRSVPPRTGGIGAEASAVRVPRRLYRSRAIGLPTDESRVWRLLYQRIL